MMGSELSLTEYDVRRGSIGTWAAQKGWLLTQLRRRFFRNPCSPGMPAIKTLLGAHADPYSIPRVRNHVTADPRSIVSSPSMKIPAKISYLEALANAPVDEVRQTWYPLGYMSDRCAA